MARRGTPFQGYILNVAGQLGAFSLQNCNVQGFTEIVNIVAGATAAGSVFIDLNISGSYLGSSIPVFNASAANVSLNIFGNVIAPSNALVKNTGAGILNINSAANDWGNVSGAQLIASGSAAGTIWLNGVDIKYDLTTNVAAVAGNTGNACQSTNGGALKAGMAVFGGGHWYALATGAGGVNTLIV